ncbi:MAG: methylenetetrahydrofolate reductase [Rhizobiales bacterium]|nr:methylenetetrahydrofolate reductase [Hyphomicrobiales bacterium]
MQEQTSDASTTTLQSRLRGGQFVLTAEIAPPLSCVAGDLLAKALPLRGLADAVNVTDGASARAHLGAVAAAALLIGAGIEPILQFTCRDRNRIALQSDLLGAAALGVRNLLLLTGDDPKAGDQPDTKPVFDLNSQQLLATARDMRDRGELPSGRKISGALAFFLGAADLPVDPKPDWKPDALKKKIAAGAQFAQTQFCMDAGVVRRYTQRLREDGIEDFHVLIGVAPLRSAKSVRWMRKHLFGTIIDEAIVARLEAADDPAAEGARICVDLIEELAGIPGVSGAHIMAPGQDGAVPDVLKAARERLGR